jgi:hypothetical protein
MVITGRCWKVLTLAHLPSRDHSRDGDGHQHLSTPHEGNLARFWQDKPRRFTCDGPCPDPAHQDAPLPSPPACCHFSQVLRYLAFYSHCPNSAWHKRVSPCSVLTFTVPPVSCEATAAVLEFASFLFWYRLLSLPRMFCHAESTHQMCAIIASSRMVMKASLGMPQPTWIS